MSNQNIRVLIADDQRLLRAGLRTILETTSDITIVGEAEEGTTAIQLAREMQPDVILMDIRMPGCDGIEATRQIRHAASSPAPYILLLTTYDMPELVIEGLRAGAAGYLLKDCTAEELCAAIRTVARGQVLLQTASAAQLLAGLTPPSHAAPQAQAHALGLTAREQEVLHLLGQGYDNNEMARTLSVSEATIKTHISHVYAKLGARDRGHAVALAHQLGLV